MKKYYQFIILLFVALGLLGLFTANAHTAFAQQSSAVLNAAQAENNAFQSPHSQQACPNKRVIPRFLNEHQVEGNGFNFQVFGPGGSYDFERENRRPYLSLSMEPFPFNGEVTASRISEIDTSLPPEDRTFCWQPTETKDVVLQFTHRFEQAAAPPGLTENLFLWNAALDSDGLITSIGVTRNNIFGGYFAVVTQDFDLLNNTGLLQLVPMPAWLDATQWHTVDVVVTQEDVVIKVTQNGNTETVVQTTLLHPPEPLGFEFSIDNEVFPGFYSPVTVPDQLDVSFYGIGLR